MDNKKLINSRAVSDRNKGLIIAIAASLVLVILAAYRIPLIHNELDGTIIGVSGSHTGEGTEFIAIVNLDTGSQVIASIAGDLKIRTDTKAKIMESRSLFGHKSYTVIAYSEQAHW
jgi:hypothetical protein